jgi:hypothetical protein
LYQTWNKENVDDAVILMHMKEMSKGKISLDPDDVRKYNLLESSVKDRPQGGSNTSFPSNNNSGGGYQNKRNFSGGSGNGGGRDNNNFKNKTNRNFKYKK